MLRRVAKLFKVGQLLRRENVVHAGQAFVNLFDPLNRELLFYRCGHVSVSSGVWAGAKTAVPGMGIIFSSKNPT